MKLADLAMVIIFIQINYAKYYKATVNKRSSFDYFLAFYVVDKEAYLVKTKFC